MPKTSKKETKNKRKFTIKTIIFITSIAVSLFHFLIEFYSYFVIKSRNPKLPNDTDGRTVCYFKFERARIFNDFWTALVDLFLLSKVYTFSLNSPSSLIFIISIFAIRFFLSRFPFDFYVTRILAKKYPKYNLSQLLPKGLPPNNPFGYILFYVVIYFFEIIFFKITNVTEGFFQNKNNKKTNSSESESSSSSDSQTESDDDEYETEIIVIEEEEEEDQINDQQDKEWFKQQNQMRNGDEKDLPIIDIETGKLFPVQTKQKTQNKVSDESSDSDESDVIEVHVNYCLANWFWFIHFAAIAGIFIAFSYYIPLLIQPSYGNVEKVTDKDLLKTVRRVSKTVHYPLNSLFLLKDKKMPPNAFVTGLKNKRILVTEKLIETLSTSEVAAILGHEIGHWYNNDIVIGSCAKLFPFFLYSVFIQYVAHHGLKPFGFKRDIQPCVLVFLGIVVFDITNKFWIPITNIAKRTFERGADCFSVSFDLPLAESLSKIKEKPEEFTPPKLARFFFDSHPLRNERIDNMCHCKKIVWPKVKTNI